MDFNTLIATYGQWGAIFVIVLLMLVNERRSRSKVDTERATVDNKQDDTLTNFSIKFDARNEQLSTENKELRDGLHKVQLEQAEQKGREQAREEAHERERQRWEAEKNVLAQKNLDLENRVLKLEAQDKIKDTLVKELEAEIDSKQAEITATNEILTKQITQIESQTIQIATLTNELEKETYRANGLADLVKQIQTIDAAKLDPKDNTIPIPDLSDVAEDTYIPDIES